MPSIIAKSAAVSLALSLAAHSSAAALTSRASTLQWGNCTGLNTTVPLQCTTIAVPLDYTNKSSNATLNLDLIKYAATNGTSKGSVLLNFGGPGQDGLTSMPDYAPTQSKVLGGQYDMISWDPRGTGKTLLFDCWPDVKEYEGLGLNLLPNASDVAYGRVWAETGAVAEKCYAQLNRIGDLVGMAFVARDMMQIVDALGEDGMLRYWGISGGTTLGATVAAMFPDRVERVLLDGVMNAHQYYHGYETQAVAGADSAMEGFIAGCIAANPTRCPLARNRTVSSLTCDLRALIHKAKYSPTFLGPIALDYSFVKNYIFITMYRPRAWPGLATFLDALMNNNQTVLTEILSDVKPTPSQKQAVLGIRCGDKVPRSSEAAALRPVAEEYWENSEWFGDLHLGAYGMACAQWRFEVKERYLGDFSVQTRKPLLFVSSPHDPVTPFVSAKNMSMGFVGSGLLQHNGYGHTSIPDVSNCTNAIIARYFDEGVVPANGTICEPNIQPFAEPASRSANMTS